MNGNGHPVKVKSYKIRYADGEEETVEGDSVSIMGLNVIAVVDGPNIERLISIPNLVSIKPIRRVEP